MLPTAAKFELAKLLAVYGMSTAQPMSAGAIGAGASAVTSRGTMP